MSAGGDAPRGGAEADAAQDEAGRWIELEGCLNFRDLGGYATREGRRVRTGRLFRSDALHHLSPADVCRLRDELGVRTVVDLRSSGEIEREPRSLLCADPVRYHPLPLFDTEGGNRAASPPAADLGELYLLMLRFAQERIARVVELLAASEAPAVFHCAAGKDRTGVVSAVVLGLLGVPDETLVRDYASSRRNLPALVERLHRSESYRAVFRALPPDTLHAEPATMERFLARVAETWGSLDAWAGQAGIPDAARAQLRRRLLV